MHDAIPSSICSVQLDAAAARNQLWQPYRNRNAWNLEVSVWQHDVYDFRGKTFLINTILFVRVEVNLEELPPRIYFQSHCWLFTDLDNLDEATTVTTHLVRFWETISRFEKKKRIPL